MLKLPYGISDFEQVRSEGYIYIDRTHFIPIVEETGKQLLFLRPRRFGKSLWLSMLANYYDVARSDRFEQLFGTLTIGKNPTALHNRYLIMRWDFSGIQISGSAAEFRTVLYNHINRAISDCCNTGQPVGFAAQRRRKPREGAKTNQCRVRQEQMGRGDATGDSCAALLCQPHQIQSAFGCHLPDVKVSAAFCGQQQVALDR